MKNICLDHLFFHTHYCLASNTRSQNNLRELWSLLHYLLPAFKFNADPFQDAANIRKGTVQMTLVRQANRLLRTFMLRRTKAVVENLPPKIETTILVPLRYGVGQDARQL